MPLRHQYMCCLGALSCASCRMNVTKPCRVFAGVANGRTLLKAAMRR